MYALCPAKPFEMWRLDHKSSELASLPALFFLWEGFLALPILATWMAPWSHGGGLLRSGHTLQMWSERWKQQDKHLPQFSCATFLLVTSTHILSFYQSCHMLAHRVCGAPRPSDCFAWMLLKRVLPELKITDTKCWTYSRRSAKATSHICRRRPLLQTPWQNVWTEMRRFTLTALDFIFVP